MGVLGDMAGVLKKALGTEADDDKEVKGMDVLDLLMNDHRVVDGLFEQLEALPAGQQPKNDQRDLLFGQLKYELTVHANVEEKIFYPAMESSPDMRDLVREAVVEHTLVRGLLAELEALPATEQEGRDKWMAKLKVLKENVQHHVREEQDDLFPKVRLHKDAAERMKIGQRIEAAKKAPNALEDLPPSARENMANQAKAIEAQKPTTTGGRVPHQTR